MFLKLFMLIIVICFPGIFFMLRTEKKLLSEEDEEITDLQRLVIHFTTVALFAALGAFTVPRVTLLTTTIDTMSLLSYGVIGGVICSIGNIVFYYFYLKRRIPHKDYVAIEKHYRNMGILTRIFYGGFIEEIIFRWGIMGLLLWLCQFIFSEYHIFPIILALSVSSMLFALVHVPSIKVVIEHPPKSVYVYTYIGNIWVGFFTGIAFIESGIFAAIIVHILFHLLWYPVQLILTSKEIPK
ncbi:CPBP family intramembrane metalloprotease [Bacillus sp. BGMRC 2118]|nr:CPBP family intramembrane metalloprotease [Bacillus sp. BGMRC 2118]